MRTTAMIRTLIPVALAAGSCLHAAGAPPLRWIEDEGSLALAKGESVFWRLHFAGGEKPHFHPLTTAGGTELTWDRPFTSTRTRR